MNEIVNTFLLAGDTFMPEIHLKQPRFTYSACGTFTKNKDRVQKFKETGDTDYIKKQEAKGLLSKLGIKTPFNKILILGDILF